MGEDGLQSAWRLPLQPCVPPLARGGNPKVARSECIIDSIYRATIRFRLEPLGEPLEWEA
ncbi:hypothetical protein BIWAKO_06522 [Bosea sp. BIWAKO-01]|nr:hypothetical protein BIWAKO_06522 [Bosea sp. BIWAKO-01]